MWQKARFIDSTPEGGTFIVYRENPTGQISPEGEPIWKIDLKKVGEFSFKKADLTQLRDVLWVLITEDDPLLRERGHLFSNVC